MALNGSLSDENSVENFRACDDLSFDDLLSSILSSSISEDRPKEFSIDDDIFKECFSDFPSSDAISLEQLREWPEYHESRNSVPKKPILLGTRSDKRKSKWHLKPDQMLAHYMKPENFEVGTVLCPERDDRLWSYEMNMAFMLGGIEAGRCFQLITPRTEYESSFITGTIDELLWLEDNGYSFIINLDNTVSCLPPLSFPNFDSPAVMKRYQGGNGQHGNQAELNERKRKILQLDTIPTISQKPYAPRYNENKHRGNYLVTTRRKQSTRFDPRN